MGEFSLVSSRIVGPNGFVVAVEPNPEDFKTLTANIKKNRISNILALNNAFSDTNDTFRLTFKGMDYTASGITYHDILEILKEHRRKAINVIKMDIEGAEITALRNLSPALQDVRLIAIELHGTDMEVQSILEPFGFVFSRLKKSQYLSSSLKFAFRHPSAALKLWRLFNESGENPGLLKIAKGVEISASSDLSVGIYSKVPHHDSSSSLD